jgi:hypothetical protein
MVCAILAAAVPTGSAVAGYGHNRDGTILGATAGWGWTRLNLTAGGGDLAESVDTATEDAFAGAIRASFAPNDALMYGVAFGGWRKSFGTDSITYGYIDLGGHWFPGGRGLFLRGSLGLGYLDATVRREVTDFNVVSLKRGALDLHGGAGYEFRIQPNLALGAAFDLHWADLGEFAGFSDVEVLHYSFGLNFSYYP